MKNWILEEKKGLVFYGILLVNFYLFPLWMKDTGSAMFFMLMVIPLVCFFDAVVYGVKNGFHLRFALITAVLFVPSIVIFYNSSAWVYIIGYGIIALFGNVIGSFFLNVRNS